ncbi:hypothetical protein AC09_1701 [Escherichia coli 6-175-07_S3_C1]|nr:hypothetical protein AD15_0091 [Escherichia coli 3-105-05_S4_C2]KEJ78556.1 hypothetical protein AC37_2112 [Escherichia coli 6-175-07_S3_C2]KEL96144.1 hypothetical protein AC09_1701 [Escherichia coli 6-175-07_S3_C1]KEM03454.1 hypothetical protein AC62_1727 [Escherichia coli 6-175-07_S3_C3]KEM22174.1 hypothetical protein AC10_1786 [Escherichia coli 6-319-05_S3_C1]KEM31393.1 hypothetical protein AC38_1844 [Escherichia coli 6-319-05_S3_C2]KEM63443.1 hypothetical protein AC63_1717 [Escherichia 
MVIFLAVAMQMTYSLIMGQIKRFTFYLSYTRYYRCVM